MTKSSSKTTNKLTPEDLVDLLQPANIKLSPFGKHVVYQAKPIGRKGEKKDKVSIWVADTVVKESAKQVTSGEYNDINPAWSTDDQKIYFISDRAGHEKPTALYSLLTPHGQAKAMTPVENEKPISSFAVSPDGKWIAYLSPDEDNKDRKKAKEDRDDAEVYRSSWEYDRVRLLNLETEQISTVFNGSAHAGLATFSPDSESLVFSTTTNTTLEAGFIEGTQIWRYKIAEDETEWIADIPNGIQCLAVDQNNDDLFFLSGLKSRVMQTAGVIWRLNLKSKIVEHHAFGEEETVGSLSGNGGHVTALVNKGLSDLVYLIRSNDKPAELHQQRSVISSFEAVAGVLGMIYSDVHVPFEVYSIVDGKETQLSNHGEAITKLHIVKAEAVICENEDGLVLDGVFAKPGNVQFTGPWPTFFRLHGGPYGRSSFQYHLAFEGVGPLLLQAGIAILAANYRGSSGHGEEFAAAGRGTMGTFDYQDSICVLKAAIKKGLVDPDRIIIGGWSQGGFLTYWSVVNDLFTGWRGAVAGAGVTDWDTLSMTSDIIGLESELAGGAPWRQGTPADSIKTRSGSAIWHLDKLKTPMLLLHGELDERVPVSQAKAWYEGCRRRSKDVSLVIYPREPHGVRERLHVIDIANRVVEFCKKHLDEPSSK